MNGCKLWDETLVLGEILRSFNVSSCHRVDMANRNIVCTEETNVLKDVEIEFVIDLHETRNVLDWIWQI